MSSPSRGRKQRFRKTKAELIEEIEALEQHVADFQSTSSRARRADDYLAGQELTHLARFLSENPNPVLRVTANARVLYANDAALAIQGLFVGVDKRTLTPRLAKACDEMSQTTTPRDVEFETQARGFVFSMTPVAGEIYINLYGRDITEHKQAEQELARKEAQLRVALDNMPGGMTLEASDGRYVLINSQYAELHDYPEDFLKAGMSVDEEVRFQIERGDFGPGSEDAQVKEMLGLYRRGNATSWERTLPHGRTRRFNVAPTPQGGYATITTDITELKDREKELAEKEAQLRVALDNMPGGIVLMDRHLKYVLFNAQYSQLAELPEGLLRVGGSIHDVLDFQRQRGDFGPGEKSKVLAAVLAVYRQGKAASWERTIAGTGRTIEVYVAPTPEGGYVSVLTDITARKRHQEALRESEERYALAMKGSNEGLWDWDISDGELYVSPYISTLVGLGGQDLRTTRDDLRARVHPEDLPSSAAALAAHLNRENEHYESEYRVLGPDGHYRWVHSRGLCLWDETGAPYRMAGSIGDITERKEAEVKLREAREMA